MAGNTAVWSKYIILFVIRFMKQWKSCYLVGVITKVFKDFLDFEKNAFLE